MKTLALIFIVGATLIGQVCYAQQWMYCTEPDDIWTVWPDWDNNTNFVLCVWATPGSYVFYHCPNERAFNFWRQVSEIYF
jgi:hypothetical protein